MFQAKKFLPEEIHVWQYPCEKWKDFIENLISGEALKAIINIANGFR